MDKSVGMYFKVVIPSLPSPFTFHSMDLSQYLLRCFAQFLSSSLVFPTYKVPYRFRFSYYIVPSHQLRTLSRPTSSPSSLQVSSQVIPCHLQLNQFISHFCCDPASFPIKFPVACPKLFILTILGPDEAVWSDRFCLPYYHFRNCAYISNGNE